MTQAWLAQTALRHATLARDYLRCFSTLAATPTRATRPPG